MISTNKLKARMVELNYTQADVAKKLGLSSNSICNKLNGKRDFTASEIAKLCRVLKISDCTAYFFADCVANTATLDVE